LLAFQLAMRKDNYSTWQSGSYHGFASGGDRKATSGKSSLWVQMTGPLKSRYRNIARNEYSSLQEKERVGMVGARILLVEDDELLRDLVRRNLQARHHEVHIAADAHDALTSLRTLSFDLIFLDINLPDQTGWEILRTAQREECLHAQQIDDDHCKLPVVVLSAVRVSPQRLAEFHPLAYLPKPFPMEALLRLAAQAAQRSKMNA
jgi:CheY-like chemotaxis protein